MVSETNSESTAGPPIRDAHHDIEEGEVSGQAWLCAISSGLGYMFDAYVVNVYSYVLPLIAVSFAASSAELGYIGSALLAGYMLGTFLFGWLADRFGRKPALGASILGYGVTTALTGIAPTLPIFGALRFLTGVGGAGEFAVAVPYVTEVWPKKRRMFGGGGVVFSMYAAGAIFALLMALFFAPRFGWQAAFVLAIVPALIVFGLRKGLNESARHHDIKTEQEPGASWHDGIRIIFSHPTLRKRYIIGSLLFTANAVGYWGFLVFLTQYLITVYHLTFTDALKVQFFFFGAMMVFPFIGSWAAETFGRKKAGIVGGIFIAIMSVAGFSVHTLTLFVVLETFGIGMLGYTWAVAQVYTSELFPTKIRGTGFGLVVATGRTPAILGPAITGVLISSVGLGTVAQWFAVVWVLYIVGFLLGPETKGRTLEEIAPSSMLDREAA